MEIHEIGVHITIPSFMISISPLKVSLPNNAIYSVTHSKEKVHFSYKRYSDFKRKLHTASVTMDNHVVNATHLAATSSSALYFEVKSDVIDPAGIAVRKTATEDTCPSTEKAYIRTERSQAI